MTTLTPDRILPKTMLAMIDPEVYTEAKLAEMSGNAISLAADRKAVANGLTQYKVPGTKGYRYDPKEVAKAARGTAMPKKAA